MAGVEVLVDGRVFLEGPRWRAGALWVSDMHGGEVLRVTSSGDVEVVGAVPGSPSGLGFLPDGTLLAVSMNDRLIVRVGFDATAEVHADLSTLAAGPLNDMVVDGTTGRVYVGDMGFDAFGGAPRRDGSLLRVEPDGTASVAASGLRFPNGAALTPDGRRLIVAESTGHAILAFGVDEDGGLYERRVWAEVDDSPDGICLDAEGAVWFAGYESGCFVRVENGGRITHRIEAPDGHHAIAVALGERTLYGVTAPEIHPEATRTLRASRIVTTSVDVPGCECP